MIIGAATVKLYAPWVHSLKQKRMVVKSIVAKARNKFNISISETGEQDTCQTIFLGIACAVGTVAQADSVMEHVIHFIEENTEAEILDIQREIR
ncbi:DUF503 domain-containing protein [Caproicibacter sp. BJN0012]|uniref:DUF503 domain-containing protein n=1 Tax=Caproicibacter sp. BJN0012 TaxID=3110227 RepID=UPI002E15F82C